MTDPPSYACAGCGGPIPPERAVKIFCGERCRQEAAYVRYVRRCTRDGRLDEPGITDILKIRLYHIAAGGYPERLRRMPRTLRKKIFKRDNGACVRCGEPGVDIDHIDGSSNDPDNLQLLCKACHLAKTLANLSKPEPGSDEDIRLRDTEARLRERVNANPPLHACDDDATWAEEAWRLQEERGACAANIYKIFR